MVNLTLNLNKSKDFVVKKLKECLKLFIFLLFGPQFDTVKYNFLLKNSYLNKFNYKTFSLCFSHNIYCIHY